ncbi:NAD-dependent dehydratase [Serinibacter arcticus]|uniref:NAD-dependent dehydratase n=1 Tax=Serinibacter arcticus TaxID=1655435 RepID=A0A2U1ZUJ7_9MICO|nr:SDR family oxidoreductase [Serinibacter arcticus]PWD50655.1 NAD-dependent dehydratase [Serinibacter arcticus]
MTDSSSTPQGRTVAVVGGYGKIARRLVPLLRARGDVVVPLVRRAEQAAVLLDLGARPRFLDIERSEAEAFAAAFDGVDAVVFAAGGGPDGNVLRKRSVDLEGAIKSLEGCAIAGVRRYVQISAIGVDAKVPLSDSAVWASYVVAKRDSDEAVRESGLDWTILRPGALLDSPGTDRVQLGVDLEPAGVTRDDVAATIAAVLAEAGSIHHQWDLVGGDHTVADALTAAIGA